VYPDLLPLYQHMGQAVRGQRRSGAGRNRGAGLEGRAGSRGAAPARVRPRFSSIASESLLTIWIP
jgi:hypothetical protein